MDALLDNDILFKSVAYGLLQAMLLSLKAPLPVGILAAAPYMLKKQLKIQLALPTSAVDTLFQSLSGTLQTIEPTQAELELAATFETAAAWMSVEFDAGESQLCAIFASRGCTALMTGDKRALKALEVLLPLQPKLMPLTGRVWCFEQCMSALLQVADYTSIRAAVCSSGLDQAMQNCFCCYGAGTLQTTLVGLQSYIGDLRQAAPNLLAV